MLWDHEWRKHGTCSNLSQITYFTSSVNLAMNIHTSFVLADYAGQVVSRDLIIAAFEGTHKKLPYCRYQYYSIPYSRSQQGESGITMPALSFID